ncbi:MAG: sulfatase-like hydrolase/transferase [Planctomycetota bacterium]
MQGILTATGAAAFHRPRAAWAPCMALAVAVMLVGLGGCRRDSDESGNAPAGSQSALKRGRSPNVLLISMDTTRADYLGCYGNTTVRTPHIDRLAKEGTTFLQCSPAAPITLPSHSSMMTGTYPPVHGVRDNAGYHLHANNLTLAEAVHTAGYFTAAEVACFVLNREFGLDQGFDHYHDKYSDSQTGTPETATSKVTYRRGATITDGVLAVLREQVKEPFFIFAHYFDPHQPYEPPEPFRHQYSEPYQGELAYADAQIGRLIEGLDELGFGENTLVVLTGDHGEGRWQHGEETHANFIYDTTMLVPLIFRCPGLIPSGRRVPAQVRVVDIAPTVLDYLGLPALPIAQGTSLQPLITGERDDLDLMAYSESFYPLINYGLSQLRAVRCGGWKFIHAPKPELYHVAEDPLEAHNLIDKHPERAAEMLQDLRDLLAELPTTLDAGDAHVELSPEALASLQALGYVGGTTSATSTNGPEHELAMFDPRGQDPKDHVAFMTMVSQTVGLVQNEDEHAEQALRDCISAAPNPDCELVAYLLLSELLVKNDRHAEAIEWHERALHANPDDGRVWTALGESLAYLRRLPEALAAHERAMQCKPLFARSHFAFANALTASGRLDEALTQYGKAAAIDPEWAAVHQAVGLVCGQTGRIDEAIKAYDRALILSPDNTRWISEYAALLLHAGQGKEALRLCRQWVRLTPDDAGAHAGMGAAFCALGQAKQAMPCFARAIELNPKLTSAYATQSRLLFEAGRVQEAIKLLRRGLEYAPHHAILANDLAWRLATSANAEHRDGNEAVRLAEDTNELTGGKDANVLDTLSVAYAEAGRFEDAISAAKRAMKLAQEANMDDSVARIKARISLFEKQQPFHEQP